jgi:gliding motility-associated-like protein
LDNTNLSCYGADDGIIALSEVAGAHDGFTYSINPSQGSCTAPCSGNNVEYTDLPTGVYGITITDQQGCSKTANAITISAPAEIVVDLNILNVTCNGAGDGIVEVSATGGSGELRLSPDHLALPTEVSNLTPGDYELTIVDANGCTQTEIATITEPEILDANALLTTTVSCGSACDGTVTYEVLGGTAPFGYRLNDTSPLLLSDGSIDDLCTGQYLVQIVDFNLCVDTLEFEILDPAPLVIDVNLDKPTCTGMTNGSAQITVSGGTGSLTTTFTPLNELNLTQQSDTTFSLSELAEQTFVIELVDSIGCLIRDTVEVVPDIITDMVITMFTSPETCWDALDGTATAAVQNGFPPINFAWNDNASQATPTAVGLLGNQAYTCQVTDAIGCTLSDTIFVETTFGCFFISNMITPNGDGANDFWVLGGLEYYPDAKITVFNRWGQKVYDATGYNAPWFGTYDGEQLPVADYYYIIDYSDEFEPITGTVTIKY